MTPKEFTAWRDALGGRRFLLTLGAGFVNTALRLFGFISESGYLELTGATVAVYIAARAYSEVRTNVRP